MIARDIAGLRLPRLAILKLHDEQRIVLDKIQHERFEMRLAAELVAEFVEFAQLRP